MKKIFGILLVGLFLVSMFGGCISEKKNESGKVLDIVGWLFVLSKDNQEKLLFLTYSYEKDRFSDNLDIIINENQVKEITNLENIIPDNKNPKISTEEAILYAQDALEKRPPIWLEYQEGAHCGASVILYYKVFGPFTYLVPIKDDQDNIIACVAIDPSDGHLSSFSKVEIEWVDQYKAIEMFSKLYNLENSDEIKEMYYISYHVKNFDKMMEILGGEHNA